MKKSLIAITSLLALSTGILGCSKGVEDVYSFKYHGQDAVVKHENIKFDADRYWIEIGKDKISYGHIISDDNRLITVEYNKHSIKDVK